MKRFFILLLLIAPTVQAQTVDSTGMSTIPPKSNFKFGWTADLGLTFAVTQLPSIRSFFSSNRIETDGNLDQFLSFGFGFRYRRVKLMAQVGINTNQLNEPRDGDSLVARQMKSGYTSLLVGFDVVNSRNRRLFINAGVGGIGYEYTIYHRTKQVVSAQNLLQYSRPGNIPSLGLSNIYWEVNIEYALREKHQRSFLSAVRIGYRRAMQPEPWQSDAFLLTGGPSDRISQVYFQAVYGFSTNFPRKNQR